MNNPFDYIRQNRERKAQKEAESQQRIKELEEQKRQHLEALQNEIVAEYGDLIVSVLTSLQIAAYPNESIERWGLSWYIGHHWEDREYGHVTSSGDVKRVEVSILLGKDDKPQCFLCRQVENKKEMRSKLSKDSLIEVLKQLHPV